MQRMLRQPTKEKLKSKKSVIKKEEVKDKGTRRKDDKNWGEVDIMVIY